MYASQAVAVADLGYVQHRRKNNTASPLQSLEKDMLTIRALAAYSYSIDAAQMSNSRQYGQLVRYLSVTMEIKAHHELTIATFETTLPGKLVRHCWTI